jgi:putative ABC transport system permease protein
MTMRNLERRPLRTLASIIGVALAAAILVVGTFAFDSAGYMSDLQFRQVEREDMTVSFMQVRPERAAREVAHIKGVTRVEPYRSTPVRIRSGHRSRQILVTGLSMESQLRRIVDRDSRTYNIPASGIVLTSAVAEILHVKAGDTVSLEILEKGDRTRNVVVAALADELIGMSGYMEMRELNRVIGEGRVISGAYLSIDPAFRASVVDELNNIPGVGGTATRQAMLESFDKQIADSLRLTVMIVVSLASVVSVGVIYNGIRIALSERSRELASLRVLGFTKRESAALLFGEQGIVSMLGTPAGLVLGLGLAYWIAIGFKSELYRFPVVVLPHTYLFAVAVIVAGGIGAAVLMKRRVYNLDLVAVLKTRE